MKEFKSKTDVIKKKVLSAEQLELIQLRKDNKCLKLECEIDNIELFYNATT